MAVGHFFCPQESRVTILDISNKKQIIFDCARDAFDSVLRVDLQEGVCLPLLSGQDGAPEEPIPYAQLVRSFVENHANRDKDTLYEALRLSQVRSELEKNGRYVVVGGQARRTQAGYKLLTFLPGGEGRYATLYSVDFSPIANHYNQQLDLLRDENLRDSLTNAFNRNYYEFKLRDRRVCGGVAMIDLDDFKLCNDTYGHDVGDLALREMSRVILENIRGKDALVRFGGDEFLLILPNSPPEHTLRLLERIQQEVGKLRPGSFGSFRLSLSIGAVTAKDETVSEAAYRADRILYRAKQQKNTVMTEKHLAEANTANLSKRPIRQKLLVVDDSDFNRTLLSQLLGDSFEVLEAADGTEAMAVLERLGMQISVVLLDAIMPGMDGFAVLGEMGERQLLEDIPVIMISADDDNASIRRAFEMGATDYIRRPFDAKTVEQRIRNTVKLYAKQRRMFAMLTQQTREKERNSRILIDVLSNVVGCINGESAEHVQRLKRLTLLLLERLILKTDQYGLSWKDCELISTAAMLHDIGKVGIPPEILNKPGRLTAEEYECIKTHTLIGERILKSGELAEFQEAPLLKTAVEICRWHHERFDGKGYPDGLSGESIPIAAQVAGLADVYDALVSRRVYKDAYAPEVAMEMILGGECGSFNPLLLTCLSELTEKLTQNLCAGSPADFTGPQWA